ncbi:MAG: hypothetical protein ACE5Z5_03530 [Candidatus Bathyarchaeia archaeon]
MSIRMRYSKKKRLFTVKVEDPEADLEVRVRLKGPHFFGMGRVSAMKGYLAEMMHETLRGLSLIQENKKEIFTEYREARSRTLRHIEMLDKLKEYDKTKPPPEGVIV